MDEHDWSLQVDRLEQEGLELLDVVVGAATWAGEVREPADVRRILDIGSGPGVGTCELARMFPAAAVVAVDASAAMLDRVAERVLTLGLGDRVSTHLGELPGGLASLAPLAADVAFASMSLHHVPDVGAALAAIRGVLAADGLLVVIEHGPDVERRHAPAVDITAALADSSYDVIGERVSSGRTVILARPGAEKPR